MKTENRNPKAVEALAKTQEKRQAETETEAQFTFDDLVTLAGASSVLREDPDNAEAKAEFDDALKRLLESEGDRFEGYRPSWVFHELAEEASDRAELASAFTTALVEAPEDFERLWEESEEEFDFGDLLDDYNLEVDVNAELA